MRLILKPGSVGYDLVPQGRFRMSNGQWSEWHRISATVYENRKRNPRSDYYEVRIAKVVAHL